MATGPRRVGRDQSGGSGLPEQPWVLTRGAVRARRSVLGVSAHDHPDPAVGIDHPVAGGRTAESSPMPKGAVPTDPDGRRKAVNVPVAAMGAPDGDLHRAGWSRSGRPLSTTAVWVGVPGIGIAFRGRGMRGRGRRDDRLRRGPPQGAELPRPQGYRRRRCRSPETERYRHRGQGTLPPHRDHRPDIARVRRTVPVAAPLGPVPRRSAVPKPCGTPGRNGPRRHDIESDRLRVTARRQLPELVNVNSRTRSAVPDAVARPAPERGG